MRLVNRLILSHGLLASILAAALVVAMLTLVNLYRQVRAVRESDLALIGEEEALYRAAWAIEVTARDAVRACEEGRSAPTVRALFVEPERGLELALASHGKVAARPVATTALRYLDLVRELTPTDTCQRLRTAAHHALRLELDEALTDEWIARTYELHRQLEAREEAILRSGRGAIVRGVGFGLGALVLGWAFAWRIARGVTRPLATLAASADRVGRGDFAPFPVVAGPREVVDLSSQLDRMRGRLADLDAMKQQFLASVTHELRTPLGKLREAIALLEDGTLGPTTDRQRKVLAIARRSCEAEIRLVTTLLDLSRLRAGKLLQVEPGRSIDDAVREAIAEERVEATSRSVEISLDAPGVAPPADLDGILVERAIANLVRNAVSVSMAGDVVRVRRSLEGCGPRGEGAAFARVEVRDQGPGVPAALQDHVFEPFTTRDVDGRPGRSGIGLGLALVREVAAAHGGLAELVDGHAGRTTFALWIPLQKEAT